MNDADKEALIRLLLAGHIRDDNSILVSLNDQVHARFPVRQVVNGYEVDEFVLNGVFSVDMLKAMLWWAEHMDFGRPIIASP